MADNRSQGPVQVVDASVTSINDALRQVQIRLDHTKGLGGRVLTYDRVRVEDAAEAKDAINVDTGETDFVTIVDTQTITGGKTFSAATTFSAAVTVNAAFSATAGSTLTLPVRMIDSNGHLLHSFGTTT